MQAKPKADAPLPAEAASPAAAKGDGHCAEEALRTASPYTSFPKPGEDSRVHASMQKV